MITMVQGMGIEKIGDRPHIGRLSADEEPQLVTTAQQLTGKSIKWVQDTVMLKGHFC